MSPVRTRLAALLVFAALVAGCWGGATDPPPQLTTSLGPGPELAGDPMESLTQPTPTAAPSVEGAAEVVTVVVTATPEPGGGTAVSGGGDECDEDFSGCGIESDDHVHTDGESLDQPRPSETLRPGDQVTFSIEIGNFEGAGPADTIEVIHQFSPGLEFDLANNPEGFTQDNGDGDQLAYTWSPSTAAGPIVVVSGASLDAGETITIPLVLTIGDDWDGTFEHLASVDTWDPPLADAVAISHNDTQGAVRSVEVAASLGRVETQLPFGIGGPDGEGATAPVVASIEVACDIGDGFGVFADSGRVVTFNIWPQNVSTNSDIDYPTESLIWASGYYLVAETLGCNEEAYESLCGPIPEDPVLWEDWECVEQYRQPWCCDELTVNAANVLFPGGGGYGDVSVQLGWTGWGPEGPIVGQTMYPWGWQPDGWTPPWELM